MGWKLNHDTQCRFQIGRCSELPHLKGNQKPSPQKNKDTEYITPRSVESRLFQRLKNRIQRQLHTRMWVTEMHMKKCLLKRWAHMVTKLRERKPCHVSLCRPSQRLSVEQTHLHTKRSSCRFINCWECVLFWQLTVKFVYFILLYIWTTIKKKTNIYFTVSTGDAFILKRLTGGKDLHIRQSHIPGKQNTHSLKWKLDKPSATLKLCSIATGQWKQVMRCTVSFLQYMVAVSDLIE